MKPMKFAQVLTVAASVFGIAIAGCQAKLDSDWARSSQAEHAPAGLAQQPVLTPVGTTYPYTQQLQWLDPGNFIVGRLDGSMTIFRPPGAEEFGPTLTDVLRTPANRGVEMLAVRDDQTFVTSNDGTSLTVWRRLEDEPSPVAGRLPPFARYRNFSYAEGVGIANSGVYLTHEGQEYLVTGHEGGFVLIWGVEHSGRRLSLLTQVDVRSPDPIPSPFQLWNVRDIVVWENGVVITGSEDGDLVMLSVPTGQVLVRKRYNPTAQRGINGLAILDDYLVAVVCSVGPDDQNTWLFRVLPTEIESLSSVDVKQDLTLPQSFAFRAAMVDTGDQPHVFVTSQEGLLWTVVVTPSEELEISSSTSVDFPLGDALDYEPSTGYLAVVGVLVNLFQVGVPN